MTPHALAVCAVLVAGAAFAQRPKVLIISLGDSSASGEGNPDSTFPNTQWRASDTTDPRKASLVASDRACHRSSRSGPRLAADAFRNLHPELDVEFTSFACSGAKVGDVIGIAGAPRAHDGTPFDPIPFGPPGAVNLPLQVQQVIDVYGNERIDALILNIGINDLGFGSQVTRCMAEDNCWFPLSPGFPNTAQLEADLRSRYDALRTELARLLPNVANIYVNEYPDATRNESSQFCNGVPLWCWVPVGFPPALPVDPRCSPDPLVMRIDALESQWASTAGIGVLNDVIHDKTAQSEDAGWHMVGGVSSRFVNHGFCAADRWVLNLTDSLSVQGLQTGTLHPNASGHAVYRDAMLAQLETLKPPATPVWNAYPQSYGVQGLMRVSWQPVAGAVKYQVGVRAPAGSSIILPRPAPAGRIGDSPTIHQPHYLLSDTTSLTFERTNLSGNVDFIVRACTASMCSPWSIVKRLTTLVPPPPVSVRPGAVSSASIEVRFAPGPNPVIGTYYYNLMARRRGATYWSRYLVSASATSFSVPVTSGTWDFALNACSTPDLCSAWSEGISVSTSPPNEPGKLKFEGGVFSWVNPINNTETGYELAWVGGSFSTTYRVPVPRSVTSVALIGVTRGPWVRACNDAGCSTWETPTTSLWPAPAALPYPPRPANAPTPPAMPPPWP